jgi:hypothetical protein
MRPSVPGGSYGNVAITSPSNPMEDREIAITSPSNPMEDMDSGGDSSAGTGEEEIPMMDASGMPFRFNPPLHPAARHVRADFGAKTYKRGQDDILYSETAMKFGADSARRDGGSSAFENLRLGRIVQGDMALTAAMLESNKRYGMRFLYNPSQVSGGLSVGVDFIPSQQSTGSFVLQEGLEQLTFEILVNRIPDVQTRAGRNEYGPISISKEDRKQIQERGTHYDIDFLYRCANGTHNLRSRSTTGDIGLLLPNPCNLVLGPYTTRGALTSVKVDDQMFSQDMVPILSYVTITFTRFLSTTPEETSRLESSGISRDDSSTAGEGTEVASPGRNALSGSQVYNLAKGAGFTSSQADTMTQIAWKESGWNASALNPKAPDLSFGLWQINMYGDLGPSRRRAYGLKSNSDLFNAATNARVARGVWKSQGFNAWSVYKNGSYKNVKIDWR